MVVLLVLCEMGRQMVDTGGQQGDLDFRGTGIVGSALIILDDRTFSVAVKGIDRLLKNKP